MRTITQQEFENAFETYCQYVEEHVEDICIVCNDGKKVVLINFDAYQLLLDKKITISGDNATEESLSDSERDKLLNILLEKKSASRK